MAKISPKELARLREVESLAREILTPMMTANDGGKMWCAFSRDNHANMSEAQATDLIKKFEIHTGGFVGDFALRIVIPIIMNRELVSYTGRDITDKASLRYKNAKIEESKIPVKRCTYNIDSVRDVAIYVEGPTDVWRGGDGFVCTFGTKFTSDHVSSAIGLKKAFVLYDAEDQAQEQAEKLCHCLSAVVPSVEKIILSDGDPGSMTDQEINELRRDIGI